VEDFFDGYKNWHTIENASIQSLDKDNKDLALMLTESNGENHSMLIQFMREDIFRMRFHPGKENAEGYSLYNTRSLIFNEFDILREKIADFTVNIYRKTGSLELITVDASKKSNMKMVINYVPFFITIFGFDGDEEFQVMSTSVPGIYFIENGFDGEYNIIQSMNKPGTAKYIGFGEHGGIQLSKNTAQLTYFNFDNMRYSQVYNNGPLDEREPLYHSDPFFMEFYGVPGKKSVYGIFIDNPSEICMDIRYLNSSRYMFGSRFGEMDYYFFLGKDCTEIIDAFTSIVGKSRLKPRYALGYHQGCYGYDNREKVDNCAEKYRDCKIPLDGIHIDVDMQKDYKTFTIDTSKFPDPKGMFSNLRNRGIKCSTNITPIISNENPYDAGDPDKNPTYNTYFDGVNKGYFVTDERYDAGSADARKYYCYVGGSECPLDYKGLDFNSGAPYIGEVNYGDNWGTTGHYPDFGRKEVRIWWGEQYKYLFNMGLEMIWQDMTTPCIAQWRGDMKSFPARLLVTNDFVRAFEQDGDGTSQYPKTPFIKMWNFYAYNLHKATYYGLNYLPGRENTRNFIIGRGCFTGAHRFAGLWTGDNCSSWDFLKINISQVLALGLTGQALAGQDIGGFEQENDEQWADPELLIRWTVMGAFLPWFRNHYSGKPGKKLFQEPYMYQTVIDHIPDDYKYMYRAVLPVCKYYIELRYRLMQLFYDRMFENTLNGMPICRAMFLTDDDDTLFNDKIEFLNTQFIVGNDLLVAPILDKSKVWRNVYLPAGSNWYCFTDNKQPLAAPVEGGTTINYNSYISEDSNHLPFIMPLYVRAGAIIPTIELEQYVGELNSQKEPNPITINIYPGDSKKSYNMYLDDGVSRSSAAKDINCDAKANDEYRATEVSHKYLDSVTRQMIIKRIHDKYTPKHEDYFFIGILHDPTEKKGNTGPIYSVKVDGAQIPLISNGNIAEKNKSLKDFSANSWYYDENVGISFIKVFDKSSTITIMVKYN
jgi:alpha-glucosidase